MGRKTFLTVLFLYLLFPVSAQILNVEEARLRSDSINQFYGNLKFRVQIHNRSATQEEKIRYTGLTMTSQFGYLSEQHNYMLISDLKYNSVTGQPFIRTGYSHFRINWLYENTLSHETFTQVQFDYGRGLNLRWLAGAGLRYRMIDEDNLKLYLGPGLMYEKERWEFPASKDVIEEKNLIKSTNYVSYFQKISETATYNLTVYFQTGPDSEADTWRQRYSLDTGLKFNLSDKIAFVVDFTWSYEPRPIIPIIHHLYTLENGIVINF
jgi:hypothetical protein